MRMLLICTLAASLAGCSCFAPRQALIGACADPKRFNCFDNGVGASRIETKPIATKVGSVTNKTNAQLAQGPSRHVDSKTTTRRVVTSKKANPSKVAAKATGSKAKSKASASNAPLVHKKARTKTANRAVASHVKPKHASKVAAAREHAKLTQGAGTPHPTIAIKSTALKAAFVPSQAMVVPAAKVQTLQSAKVGEIFDPIIGRAKEEIAAKMVDPTAVEFIQMKRAIRKNVRGEPIDTICGRVKGRTASSADTTEMPFLYIVKDDDAYIVDGGDDIMAAAAYRNICK
jgi:hypothetical protein